MLEFLKGPFLVLNFSYYILMTFLMVLSVILLPQLIILLYSNWLLNLILIWHCGLGTVDWGRKWLFDFNAGKTQLILFHWSNNTGAVDIKMGLLLRKICLLRCWGWLSSLNWIGVLTLSQLLKVPPRKLEPWFVLRSFFVLKLLWISINLPYGHAWNTVVISRLLLLVVTWNCWKSYKNGYCMIFLSPFQGCLCQ